MTILNDSSITASMDVRSWGLFDATTGSQYIADVESVSSITLAPYQSLLLTLGYENVDITHPLQLAFGDLLVWDITVQNG